MAKTKILSHSDPCPTHPALIKAIEAAEQAYSTFFEEHEEPFDYSAAYDAAWDKAFEVAQAEGLDREDAKVVATSAASDGNADPEEGYKDIIPPFIRTVRMVVNRRDDRTNHARKREQE
jgi:hypothetical protein